ncbi:MAG: lipopolysaccharide biosynthesis protein [Pseudomonadales bacterium]|nr:lipopolysaccharide biosynthesis protein [Pseudomonadales bacterium]
MVSGRARSAVLWSGLDLFARQGLSFVVSVILARLLLPEDFGTIALLSIFLGISQLFVNAGFSQALIQKQDATHLDESTIFWFNVTVGAAVTVLLMLLAPWIAGFFELPILLPIIRFISCMVLISAVGSIHSTLYSKNLDFRTPMKIGVVSTVISGCIGIYLARDGHGVWALAIQMMTGAIATTTLLWFMSSWRPLFIFSAASMRNMMGFSGWIFASGVLETFYQRGYTLLIGKFYGPSDLGIYNRADATQQLPASMLSGILSRVTFPLFSEAKNDKDRLREGVRFSVRSMMLVMIPAMTGLAMVAEPFIREVFGEKWLAAVPILQVLCAAGTLYPLHVINLSVLQAQGHAKLYFRLEIVKKVLGITLLVIGSFYGLIGIALSRVIQSYIAFAINGHYTGRFLDYGCLDQIRDIFPSLLLSAVMAVVVALVGHFFQIGGLGELLVLCFVGGFSYLIMNALFGVAAYKEALGFIFGGAAFGRHYP